LVQFAFTQDRFLFQFFVHNFAVSESTEPSQWSDNSRRALLLALVAGITILSRVEWQIKKWWSPTTVLAQCFVLLWCTTSLVWCREEHQACEGKSVLCIARSCIQEPSSG